MRFYKYLDSLFDVLRRLKTHRDMFRPRPSDSYQEPVNRTSTVYPDDKVYERSAPSFGVAEQPYRHMQQQEFEQHISQTTSHTERSQPPDIPVTEEPSVELNSVSDAELIEMAIDAVKEDAMGELDDMGFEDNEQENAEEAFDEADEPFDDPFDDPFDGPSLDEMLEDPLDDTMANDMPDEMEEMQEMDDPQEMDPYMPFGGNPFGG